MKKPPKTRRIVPEREERPEVQSSQQVTATPAPETPAENDEEIDRIAFPIFKKTGLPAWNRMRKPDEAKRVLQIVARDPAITGAAGGANAALVPLCAQAVLLLGVLGEAYARKQGYVNAEVMRVDTGEAVPIGQLAVAVLEKYSASMKYAEEFMLGGALIGLFASKAMMLEKTKPQPVAA